MGLASQATNAETIAFTHTIRWINCTGGEMEIIAKILIYEGRGDTFII